MQNKTKWLRLMACSTLALALALGAAHWIPGLSLRSVKAAGSAPLGSYSYLVGDSGGVSIVGVLNFDGAGNLTGTYTSATQSGAGGAGSLTGTYTTSGSGSGNLNFTFDNGVGVTAAYATNNGGGGLQVLFTAGAPGLSGSGVRQ